VPNIHGLHQVTSDSW